MAERNWQTDETSKSISTPGGRIRDFSKEQKGYKYTEALNTPIQGGAAEIMMKALTRLIRYLENMDAKLVNVVHDEIILEVEEKDAERVAEALKTAMEEGMRDIFPHATAKGLVEISTCDNWAGKK